MTTFLTWLYWLDHIRNTCSDITGTPAHVVYGGNCAQAFIYALEVPYRAVAWVVNP